MIDRTVTFGGQCPVTIIEVDGHYIVKCPDAKLANVDIVKIETDLDKALELVKEILSDTK